MGYRSIEEIYSAGLSNEETKRAVKEYNAASNKASYKSGKESVNSSSKQCKGHVRCRKISVSCHPGYDTA